jgi:hypothetical protein
MNEYELLQSVLTDSNFMFLSFFKNLNNFTIDHEQKTVTMQTVTWNISDMNLMIDAMSAKLQTYVDQYPDGDYPAGAADLVTYLQEHIEIQKGFLI